MTIVAIARRALVRAALFAAMLAPSACFTGMLWRGGIDPEQRAVAIVGPRLLTDATGAPVGIQLPLDAEVAASWPWPDGDAACWLQLRLRDGEAEFAAALAAPPLPPLRVAIRGIRYGTPSAGIEFGRRFQADVELRPTPAPGPTLAVPAVELVRPVFDRAPWAVRVIATPFALLGDVLAFPLGLPWTYPLAIEMGLATW